MVNWQEKEYLVERAGLALLTDTVICERSEKRRQEGLYQS